MHLKLTQHGRLCMQNNQLPTKSHDELKDNSIILQLFQSQTTQIFLESIIGYRENVEVFSRGATSAACLGGKKGF